MFAHILLIDAGKLFSNPRLHWKKKKNIVSIQSPNLLTLILNQFGQLTTIYLWSISLVNFTDPNFKSIWSITGKSLSEALIFASTNQQYDNRLFIELQYKFNTWKFQGQTWGEHNVYRNCFWHSEQFLYTTCSPHVLQKEELQTKIYLYQLFICDRYLLLHWP